MKGAEALQREPTLASSAEELGSSVVPQSLQDAYKAETIFLAFPFSAHKDVAKQFKQWNGKIVVDLTNAFHVAPEELGGLLSSEVVSQAFAGARLVKAFNHLPAAQLGTNPSLEGQRQAVFVSSNDADASATVATVALRLASLQLNSEGPIRAAYHFMFWVGSVAVFCFRIWLSSADCGSHLKSMLFLRCMLFRKSNRDRRLVVKVGFIGAGTVTGTFGRHLITAGHSVEKRR
jgi:predicted dinucleotide-binding enzyme